jgi:hypothetical protein
VAIEERKRKIEKRKDKEEYFARRRRRGSSFSTNGIVTSRAGKSQKSEFER